MSSHVIDDVDLPYEASKLIRKPNVGPEGYFSNDLRVGRIISTHHYPKMKKASYKIEVDFGPVGILRTSAQITNYSIEDLDGRRVVGAINIGHRVLPGGFVSEFLILGALLPDGRVKLLEVSDDVPLGSMVA